MIRLIFLAIWIAAAICDENNRWIWAGIVLLEIAAWVDLRAFRAGMKAEREIQERE